MVSFRTTILALASAIVVSSDYIIDPDSVPLADRMAWCRDQVGSCPTICLQTSTGPPRENSCDPKLLTYACVCSDGLQPNVSEYTLTLPYHTCTRWGSDCVTACGSNSQCAYDCRQQNPCGAQSPTRVNATTTKSGAASATSAGPTQSNQVFDGLADGSEGSADQKGGDKNAAGMLRFGSSYGVAVVAGGLFAAFAMVL